MGVKQRGTCEGCARIAVAGQYGNRRKKEQKTRSCCSAANGMWVLVMVVLRPWPLLPLWSNILWARLSMGTWNRPPQRIKRWKQLKTCSPKSLIQWVLPKLNVCILMSLVIIPSSSTSPISIFQSGWPRKEIGVGSEYVLGRDFCCCCCDWPLEKMKPLADKLGVVGRVEWEGGRCCNTAILCSGKSRWRRTPNRWLYEDSLGLHWSKTSRTYSTAQLLRMGC